VLLRLMVFTPGGITPTTAPISIRITLPFGIRPGRTACSDLTAVTVIITMGTNRTGVSRTGVGLEERTLPCRCRRTRLPMRLLAPLTHQHVKGAAAPTLIWVTCNKGVCGAAIGRNRRLRLTRPRRDGRLHLHRCQGRQPGLTPGRGHRSGRPSPGQTHAVPHLPQCRGSRSNASAGYPGVAHPRSIPDRVTGRWCLPLGSAGPIG
jgi:hypothetical protein